MSGGDEDEDLFCRIALRLGLLTEVDIALALAVQGGLSTPQRIGKILVVRGLLTPDQVEAILTAQAIERGRVPEPEPNELLRAASEARTLGRLAVLRGLVTEGEVEECVFVQRQLAERGENIPLGGVLLRKGYLREEDVAALLALQAQAATVARSTTRGRTESATEVTEDEAPSGR